MLWTFFGTIFRRMGICKHQNEELWGENEKSEPSNSHDCDTAKLDQNGGLMVAALQ